MGSDREGYPYHGNLQIFNLTGLRQETFGTGCGNVFPTADTYINAFALQMQGSGEVQNQLLGHGFNGENIIAKGDAAVVGTVFIGNRDTLLGKERCCGGEEPDHHIGFTDKFF